MGNTDPANAVPESEVKGRGSAWLPLIIVLLALALIQGFAVKAYRIPSGSMEPTLEVGDRVLVNKLSPARKIGPGDVVVFAEPDTWAERPERSTLRRLVGWLGDVVGFGPTNTVAIIKRVAAGPGQEIECCDETGAIIVDGESWPGPPVAYDFPFVPGELDCETVPRSLRCFAPLTVPEGEYVMLGDNRLRSADSLQRCRSGGEVDTAACVLTVPEERIIGSLLVRFWPPSGIGVPAGLGSSS